MARGCGPGKHWSSAGGRSHCVDDDRYCNDGTLAKRDAYDNLYCEGEVEAPEGEGQSAQPKKNNETDVQIEVKR